MTSPSCTCSSTLPRILCDSCEAQATRDLAEATQLVSALTLIFNSHSDQHQRRKDSRRGSHPAASRSHLL